jgi:hypothetical protein
MTDNNPERIQSLFDQLTGALVAATPNQYQDFNNASSEIWGSLAEYVCSGAVTIGAEFGRTRRLSDHHTLPAAQIQTTLFDNHETLGELIEVKTGLVLGIVDAPIIFDTDFVFSLNIPEQPYDMVVRWPLLRPRPKLGLDMSRLTELQ